MNTNMNVTDVKVFPINNSQTKVRAFAQLVLNNCFRVTGLRVVEGSNGLFIGYPTEKGKDGKYYDIIKPLNRNGIDIIQDTVLREYEHVVSAA
jgi:stage V sporulation protein G